MMSLMNSLVSSPRWRHRVRVSFDLDDTLTSHCRKVPIEKCLFPSFIKHWLGEPLRCGTKRLFRELRRLNCSVWIYTSSGRSSTYIKRWFFLHGIRIDGVVNGNRHCQLLDQQCQLLNQHHLPRLPSKFPPAFGIDLHIDDSEGVKMEGDEHGFRVVVIHPYDEYWTEKVLNAVVTLK